jgi:similar to stage IV sporulation protein
MNSNWLTNIINGSIKVRASGKLLSNMLNQLNRAEVSLWNVQKISDDTVIFFINLKDYRYLRKIAKQTNSKVRIIEKFGIPFLNWRLGRRYMFVIGIIFFLAFIWTMSNFIWDIEIVGQDGNNLTYEQEKNIREGLLGIGIKEGRWKYKIPEKDIIQNHLREQLSSNYIWIGMEFRGTTMSIKAVPITKPKLEEEILIPSNLVAKKQAVIHKILVYEGIAKVRAGEMVRPGQVLVLGNYGEEKYIPARGVVEGIVWYTVEVEVPLVRSVDTYTGERTTRYRIGFGNWVIPLYFAKNNESLSELYKNTISKKLGWRSISLPIELYYDTYFETKKEIITIDNTKAKQIALEMALDKVRDELDFKEVVSHTIMKYNIDNDKAYLKVLIESIEDIASRQIITQ